MAMRRPRIKATALLTTKRKSRDVKADQSGKSVSADSDIANKDEAPKNASVELQVDGQTEATVPIDREEKQAPLVKEMLNGNLDKEATIDILKTVPDNDAPKGTTDITFNSSTVDSVATQTKLTETKSLETQNNAASEHVLSPNQQKSENVSFKCPPRVEYNRNNSQLMSATGSDDVFYSDMEEAALQADLQRSTNGYPMSPSKSQVRQRIRPVPVFQRRNSFVGTSNSQQTLPEDVSANSTETVTTIPTVVSDSASISTTATTLPPPPPPPLRRERHYSASLCQLPPTSTSAATSATHHHYTPHKFTPSMGRIRTESNCSAFSDSYLVPSKMRKTEEHNHRSYSRRDFEARLANGVVDKSSLKMFDLIYYNPATNPMEQRTISTVKKEISAEEVDSKAKVQESESASTVKMDSGNAASAMPVPQLKLNANGDLILDEKTLEIETTAEQEARKVLANSSLIVLDDNTGMNGFYKRQKRTKDWPPEETIKFYRCLQTVGTDFSLMCQLFPKRTRRDLKLKFKKEERSNLTLINKALLYPKIFNIDELKEQLDTEEREREETMQRWKEIKDREAKCIKKVKVKTSAAARILKHGDDIYQNENVIKRKLSKRAVNEKNKNEATKKTSLPTTVESDEHNNTRPPKSKHAQAPSTLQNSPVKMEALVISNEVVPIKIEQVQIDNKNNDKNNAPQTPDLEGNMTELLHTLDEDNVTGSTMHYETIKTKSPIKETCVETETLIDLDSGNMNAVTANDAHLEDEIMSYASTKTDATARRELDEGDIQQILCDLAEGSLVLVSTLDPDNADKVINEIYMMDKNTGELCDTPLDIPEAIVQGILSVMC